MTKPPLIANVSVVGLLFKIGRVRFWQIDGQDTKNGQLPVVITFSKLGVSWASAYVTFVATGLTVRPIADDRGRICLFALLSGEDEDIAGEVANSLKLGRIASERFYFNIGWLRKDHPTKSTNNRFRPRIKPPIAWAFLIIAMVAILAIMGSTTGLRSEHATGKLSSAPLTMSTAFARPTVSISPSSSVADLSRCFEESHVRLKTRDFHFESINACLRRRGHSVESAKVTVIGGLALLQIHIEKPSEVITAKVTKTNGRWSLIKGSESAQD